MQGCRGTEWKAVISPGRGFWKDFLEEVVEGQTMAGRKLSGMIQEERKLSMELELGVLVSAMFEDEEKSPDAHIKEN